MTGKTTTYYHELGKADAQAGKPLSESLKPGSWQRFHYECGYKAERKEVAYAAQVVQAEAAKVEAKPTPEGLPRSATYPAQVKRLKAKGVKLVACSCPKCTKIIKTLPAPKGTTWDSLTQCPHCEALFMKFTRGRKAWGVYRQEPARVS